MKKLITFLFGFIVLVFLTSPSQSQTGFIGSISTGISIPTGDLSNGYSTGFNLSGNGGYIFNRNLAARGDLSFNSFGFNFPGYVGDAFHIVSIKGDFLAGNFDRTSSIMPYGLAGIGLYMLSQGNFSETDFGMGLGGGAAYSVSHNISIFGEAQYNVVFTSGSSTTYIPFRFGALYRP
jgi:opacity protein-like surface antigen